MFFARVVGLSFLLAAGFSAPALAYVGPGAGLGAIGAALGLLAAIGMAIGLILFWPIRRALRRMKAKPEVVSAGVEATEAPESTHGS